MALISCRIDPSECEGELVVCGEVHSNKRSINYKWQSIKRESEAEERLRSEAAGISISDTC